MGERLPMSRWVKALRAELGAAKGRDAITQSELAERLGVGLSAVGKWEMGKKPQQPERESYVKLLTLASPELRARAPHALEAGSDARRGESLSGSSNLARDPDHHVQNGETGGYEVKTPEGTIIAKMLDAIPDDDVRTEKMFAAAEAIRNPRRLTAEKRPDRVQRKP